MVNIQNGLWHYNIGHRGRHKWNRRRQGCLGHMKIGHRANDHVITYGEGEIRQPRSVSELGNIGDGYSI